MDDRQTPDARWPRAWMMTDPRLGDALWRILEAMPNDAGVVLRDLALGERVAAICARRGLKLAVAREGAMAEALGAALVHNPVGETSLPTSRSVHDEAEARRAREEGAALVFVSPVYPTRSHPGAPALGEDKSVRLATIAGGKAIALGGMDADRFERLATRGFHGWAGIDAWLDESSLRI